MKELKFLKNNVKFEILIPELVLMSQTRRPIWKIEIAI